MRSPYASINAALRSLFSLSAGLGELCRGESGVVLRTPNTTREAARAVSFPARPPALGMLGVVGGLEVWNWGGAGYTRAAVEK